jgi:hypothetical protein
VDLPFQTSFVPQCISITVGSAAVNAVFRSDSDGQNGSQVRALVIPATISVMSELL